MSNSDSVPVFLAKLINRFEVAERTLAFRFEKPPGWTFKAGQFVDITLIDPPETDAEGNTRELSLASAPDEPAIMVATRFRDTAFKRVLSALPAGSEVRVEGPFGDLKLHNNASRPAVFLSGGIGITPLRSILVRAAHERLAQRIFFFYSNRRPEDAAFLDEMKALERENANFIFVPTMTRMTQSGRSWQGETGRIDWNLLGKYLSDVREAIYYITGPPGMVSALHSILNAAGIDDDDIRVEEFSGY